jgi:hypothetical protein
MKHAKRLSVSILESIDASRITKNLCCIAAGWNVFKCSVKKQCSSLEVVVAPCESNQVGSSTLRTIDPEQVTNECG